MAVLDIVLAPDPILRTKTKPVERFDADLHRLLDDMLETMYLAPGIGLAAPQVGVDQRLCVIDVSGKDETRTPIDLINPEITWRADETEIAEEGCLSIPQQYADVERPAAVRVRFQDRHGKEHEIKADGLLARCIQHELDHLDGVLFVDHLSALKRNMLLRKVAKSQRLKTRDDD